MNPMRRLFALLLAGVLLALSCTADVADVADTRPPVAPAPPADATPPGPQLVTERFKRRALDLHVMQTVDTVIAEGLGGETWHVVGSGLSEHWDRDATGWVTFRPPHYDGPAFRATVTFAGPSYAPDGGSVTTGDCRELPGGVQTTGEYIVRDNERSELLEVEIDHAVSETSSQTTSLEETLELDSGETFEAGASFPGGEAKATISFEQHFGVVKGSVAEQSTEHSEAIKDTTSVTGYSEGTFAFTVNAGAMDCELTIDSTGDWTGLVITPPAGRPYSSSNWCDHGRDDPNHLAALYYGRGSNGTLLLNSDAVDKSTCTIHLDSADGLVRLFLGYDVRCPHCSDISFSALGDRALDWFGKPESRHVSFDGRRRSSTHKDASYRAFDTTHLDDDCVRDILDDVGRLVTDDLLDACAPTLGADVEASWPVGGAMSEATTRGVLAAAGFTGTEIADGDCIAVHESGRDNDAVNRNTNGTTDDSFMQINSSWSTDPDPVWDVVVDGRKLGPWDKSRARDSRYAARYAHGIWKVWNWAPWVTRSLCDL